MIPSRATDCQIFVASYARVSCADRW